MDQPDLLDKISAVIFITQGKTMWNIMSANRILDIKWKKENQRKHLNTLRNIKSMINNLSPKKYSFLDSRPKTRQMKRQRQYQIQTHNSWMMNRMLNATSDIQKLGNAFFKDSLNATYSRKVEKEIDSNNVQLIKRLQSARSQYSRKDIKKSLLGYKRARTNIASEKMDPYYDFETVNQTKTKQNSIQRRPFSARH